MAVDAMRLEVAARIRDVREACGLSQDEVASKLGMTKAGVSYWEAGHPNLVRLRSLAELFVSSGRLEDSVEHLVNYMMGTVESFRVAPVPAVPGRVVRYEGPRGGDGEQVRQPYLGYAAA